MEVCTRCKGHIEPVQRAGQLAFYFCRACKLPYNEQGSVVIDTATLNTSFNPLSIVRGIIGGTHAGASPLARNAMEVLLSQGLVEAYLAGLKDGVLLAYSADVGDGEPVTMRATDNESLCGSTVDIGKDTPK